ncbi:MAG: hypothetical protein HRT47_06730 [Candidatus Caenarcaniphilales bacterium]|nr:hypothetical protein [Candidatus Caenarcaniphilales bacterium]
MPKRKLTRVEKQERDPIKSESAFDEIKKFINGESISLSSINNALVDIDEDNLPIMKKLDFGQLLDDLCNKVISNKYSYSTQKEQYKLLKDNLTKHLNDLIAKNEKDKENSPIIASSFQKKIDKYNEYLNSL